MIGRTNAMSAAIDPDEVTARAADVLEGKKTVNENGDVVGGLIPNHREGKECLKLGVFDEIGAFYMVFPEGFYKSYDTNSPRTWCSIYSILDTVGVDRINNYLINKHNNRVVFNGATFDNILASGVASKSVYSTVTKEQAAGYLGDSSHYVTYAGLDTMGLRFDAKIASSRANSGNSGACFLNCSIDLSYFKKIKLGYTLTSGGVSESFYFGCGIGVKLFFLDVNFMSKIDGGDYRYSKGLAGKDLFIELFPTKYGSLENHQNGSQYYKEIDISNIDYPCFVGFGIAGSKEQGTSKGSASVWINHIELIN